MTAVTNDPQPVAPAAPAGLQAGARTPELLAPAGDWACLKAAVENGADAIYFGLDKFNARMRAENFTEGDLPAVMEFLHRRGVRGYVTFNTLVFPGEMAEASRYLRTIIAAGVDAAIVQDVGMCRLIREISPDFPIHASTQMTVTSAAGVAFARELGCNLVVLARECSIADIEKMQNAQTPGQPEMPAMPLEVFVHGALCVAYSGQCLTSESLGGRSANRGECAQACRMTYELVSDGQPVPLGDRRYLLSPQDLAGMEVLPELVRAGVSSLKIEGRLKSPEYVAAITRVYRDALDRLAGSVAEAAQTTQAGSAARPHSAADERYAMEMSFSRGLHTGWFRGTNNQVLVHARFGKKRGVFLGEVRQLGDGRVTLRGEAAVRPGDGVVFDHGRPDEKEEGGRVYFVTRRGSETVLEFGRDDVDLSRIHAGDRVWKTSDPEWEKRVRQTYAGDLPKFQRPLDFEAHGGTGELLTLVARDELGHRAEARSEAKLEPAVNRPLTTEYLRQQLGRLGGTPFCLGELANHLPATVVLPVSELNRLRRVLVAEIEAQRQAPRRWALTGRPLPTVSPDWRAPTRAQEARPPELIVLARSLPQIQAALEGGIETIYCELEQPKNYREAVALVRSASAPPGRPRKIWVAPPRIFKAGEDWILRQVLASEADGYLVRNYDHLAQLPAARRIGDFSLNVANWRAAEHFIQRHRLERVTASYDLDAGELEALLQTAPPDWFEITLHQHMPMFHMEHCVFCAFLSSGTDYTNCGRPCEKHEVRLRDRMGAEHALKADAGCRNTVYNARAQTGAEFFDRMIAAGARRFRIEFLNESREEAGRTLALYQKLFRGEITGTQLWRELKLLNQLGVTRGQLAGRSGSGRG